MNLNISPSIDAQAPIRDHETAIAAESREAAVDSLTTPCSEDTSHEPSPSERLYEAYRLWALSGR